MKLLKEKMHLHWERNPNVAGDCNIRSLSWMGRVPDEIPQVRSMYMIKCSLYGLDIFFKAFEQKRLITCWITLIFVLGGRMEIKSKSLLPRRLVKYGKFTRGCGGNLYNLSLWRKRLPWTFVWRLSKSRPSKSHQL